MIMKIKKRKTMLTIGLLLIIVLIVIYNLFYNINTINGKYLYSITSPDNKKEADVYLVVSKDMMSSTGILVSIYNKEKFKTKKIYFDYPAKKVNVFWKDNKTIIIDDKKLNIYKDEYDWRKK